MSEEVKPLQSGREEVSTPVESAPYTKICAFDKCGVVFDPGGLAYKFCKNHRIEKSSPDLVKRYNREATNRSRGKKKEQSYVWDSKIIATRSDAMELLAQRVINPHVREVCYDLGVEAASETGVTPNKWYWQNGLTQAVLSKKEHGARPLEMDHSAIIQSEVIHQGDAYAIWDYSVSWRESDVKFSDFIETRRILKSDWFELGKFLNVPLEESPHRSWQQFLPAFEPSLRPGYTLQDQREWLSKQKSPSYPVTTRDFLLQSPRGAMKTSAGQIFLAQALLCAPSLRLLVCSETTDFSRKFVKKYRAMWERGSDPAYDRFQYYFPEFCVQPGAGAGSVRTFTSPMRAISVQDETMEA